MVGTPSRHPMSALVAATLAVLAVLSGCINETDAGKGVPGAPQTGSVAGAVVDDERVPIPGAVVRHLGGNASTRAGPDGAFNLTGLPRSTDVVIQAGHEGHKASTLRVDLSLVPHARATVVLEPLPRIEPYHRTNTTQGRIVCQVAFGTHHGFPGYYSHSCSEFLAEARDQVRVPFEPAAQGAIVELLWTPQSPAVDVMGLTLYLSTSSEELLLGLVHSEAGTHYLHMHVAGSVLAPAREQGGVLESHVHVEPSIFDDHVPTNLGAAVDQGFTLHTTTFYVEPPPPTWSFLRQ